MIHNRLHFLRSRSFPRGWVLESWLGVWVKRGFDPSFGNLATLKSSDRTKQICLWMTRIYYIYISHFSAPDLRPHDYFFVPKNQYRSSVVDIWERLRTGNRSSESNRMWCQLKTSSTVSNSWNNVFVRAYLPIFINNCNCNGWLVVSVLWHINACELFNGKSCLYIVGIIQ